MFTAKLLMLLTTCLGFGVLILGKRKNLQNFLYIVPDFG